MGNSFQWVFMVCFCCLIRGMALTEHRKVFSSPLTSPWAMPLMAYLSETEF